MEIEINSLKHGKFTVLIDDYDLKLLENKKLYIHRIGKYLYTRVSSKNGDKISLHRLIMDNPVGKVIDHINRNTLDNRRSNLRVCSIQENLRNQKRGNNKTGCTGVSIHHVAKGNTQKCKKHTIYEASIKLDYKKIYLGIFHTLEGAVRARKEAELKYWGQKSLN